MLYDPEGPAIESVAEQFKLFFEREEKKVNKGVSFSVQVRAHTAYNVIVGKPKNNRLMARLMTRDRDERTFDRIKANFKG